MLKQSHRSRCFTLAAMLTILVTTACTNERSTSQVSQSLQPSLKATSVPSVCSPEDLALFERPEGEVVDLEREQLPRGLFLASDSLMLVEKPLAASSTAGRVVIREVPGSKSAEIVCSQNPEQFNEGFEIALTGLVKFETAKNPQGAGFKSRQFYYYSGRDGHGAIVSRAHPKNQGQATDLKAYLRSQNAQLVRVNENLYLVRSVRERDGGRARLMIRLEFVPRSSE